MNAVGQKIISIRTLCKCCNMFLFETRILENLMSLAPYRISFKVIKSGN